MKNVFKILLILYFASFSFKSFSQITVVTGNTDTIKKFGMEENKMVVTKKADNLSLTVYPNPLKEISTLNFELPENDTVTIKLYDVEGRTLKTLYNRYPLRKGFNLLEFEVKEIDQGFYLVQLMSRKKLFGKAVIIVQ